MPYKSKEKQLEYMREYHADGYDMLRRYGLSKEDYQKMWDSQKGKCAICGKSFDKENVAHIDHNHKTKRVRGLLCKMCNWGIGHFDDDKELLLKAIKYLGRMTER